MKNPYNIDPSRFTLRRLGLHPSGTIFIVEPGEEPPLAMCMFRDLLTRFLFDELEGDWDVRNFQNSIQVTLKQAFDIQRVRDNFRVA
jgi:hypothetical protein